MKIVFSGNTRMAHLCMCEEHESEAQYLNDDLKSKPAEKIDLFGYLFASQFAAKSAGRPRSHH